MYPFDESPKSEYKAAAVCTRGHVETTVIDSSEVGQRCQECGAEILTGCPGCGHRIRGYLSVPGVMSWDTDYKPPKFCDNCGRPFPWLDRQGRIYLLENMLDEEQLDPAAELEAREQLRALAQLDPDDEDAERRWKKIRGLAPGLWEKAGGREILQSVVSAGIKGGLGL